MAGSFKLSPGPLLSAISIGAITASVILAIFVLTCPFSFHEKVDGALFSTPPLIEVKSPEGGVLQNLLRSGDVVTKNGILAYIKPVPEYVDGTSLPNDAALRLRHSLDALEKQVAAISEQKIADLADDSARSTTLKNSISSLERSIEYQEESISLIKTRLMVGQKLEASGTISQTDLQQRQLDLTNAHLQLETLVTSLNQDVQSLADTLDSRARIQTDYIEKINTLGQQKFDLQGQLTRAVGQESFGVPAPADGVVDSVPIDSGQRVEAGQVIGVIRPERARLAVYIYIPSRMIVFVHSGQRVRLTYDAFPIEEYNSASGVVQTVSTWLAQPGEMGNPPNLSIPSYRAVVALDRQYVIAHGRRFDLEAGMSLKADIIIERRTLGSWILQSALKILRSR